MRTDTDRYPAGASRRQVLALAAGGAAGAALLPGLPAGAATTTGAALAAAATSAGPPLPEPEVRRSQDGVLDVTLRAAPTSVVVAGRARDMLTYDGALPGPTLLVHPGDLLRVRLVNEMAETTNIHTHGLHVSGEGNQDNVFIRVDPGESFQYEIPLRPDHHAGTNWYHPHAHGHSAGQMFRGLAGALVVEHRNERARGLGVGRDRVLHLSTTQFVDDGPQVLDPLASRQSDQVRLVNGVRNPVIDVAPGETQRWRLVNSSVNHIFRLQLDGMAMTQIARDGVPFRRAVTVQELLIPSGGRADVLVTGGPEGVAVLRTLDYDVGFGVVLPEEALATVVTGGPAARGLRAHPSPLLRPFDDLRRHRVDVHRDVTFTMAGGFGIDGKPYMHDRVDQVCELGALEEWTVHNPTGLVHPFHIHVNPFQVTHVSGVPVDADSYQDVVIVPNRGGSVTFRTRFEHFLGTAIYHCHFVTHAELGMMATAEIVPPARG